MGEAAKKRAETDEVWRTHILAAENFQGSGVKYCRTHGLSIHSFYGYRRKLGFVNSKAKPMKKFVRIESAILDEAHHTLPDPKWTAEFVRVLMESR